MSADQTNPPAPRPCESCPYHRDVPAGIWSAEEYAKLPEYDLPTPYQPHKMFLCHQTTKDSPQRRVCAGWVAVHDMEENLSIRILSSGPNPDISLETLGAILEYTTPVEVFSSGGEAASYGISGIENLTPEGERIRKKIVIKRPEVLFGYRKDDDYDDD